MAAFWAEALDYTIEDHSTLIQSLLDDGQVTEADVVTVAGRLSWRTAAAVRDPDEPVDPHTGIGRAGRVLFQVVPEGKPGEPRTGAQGIVPSRPTGTVMTGGASAGDLDGP